MVDLLEKIKILNLIIY